MCIHSVFNAQSFGDEEYIIHCIKRFLSSKADSLQNDFRFIEISFEEIDSSELLTGEERAKLYTELAKYPKVAGMCAAIKDWLQKLDEQRANLQQDDFDDFLKSL